MRILLLLFLTSAVLMTACDRNNMEEDAVTFANYKCKLKEIDAQQQTGELNFMETEDAKEPYFDSLEILQIRYRAQRDEFDSLVGLKVEAMDCTP